MTEDKVAWFKRPERILAALAVLWVLGAGLWFSSLYNYRVCDDAYTAMRYAKNLTSGHGFVFNRNEYIDACLNFLWVLIIAPVHMLALRIGIMPAQAVVLASICISALNILLLYAISRSTFEKCVSIAILPVFFLAADNTFLVNSVMGLETPLLMLLLLFGTLLLQKDLKSRSIQASLGLLCALLLMSRSDALLPAAVLFVALILKRKKDSGVVSFAAGGSGIALLFLLLPLAGWYTWRLFYYAEALPNVLLAGVFNPSLKDFQRGLEYINCFLVDELYLPILIIPALFVSSSSSLRILSAIAISQIIFVLISGGDHYTFSRHLLTTLPASCLSVAVIANALISRMDSAWFQVFENNMQAVALCGALIILFYGLTNGPFKREIVAGAVRQEAQVRLGQWLKTVGRRNDTVLSQVPGTIAYYSGLRVINTLETIENNAERIEKGSLDYAKNSRQRRVIKGMPTLIPWNSFREKSIDWESLGFSLYTNLPSKLLRFGPEIGPGIWIKSTLPPEPLKDSQVLDFEEAHLNGWTINSDSASMNRTPVSKKAQQQLNVRFFHGNSFLSTFDPVLGDKAKATFISPKFRLLGDVLCMLVAGGRRPDKLHIDVKVGDQVIITSTGARTEYFGRQCFLISKWKGQKARLKVVDQSRGRWGHIMVDYVTQYNRH